MLFNSYIFILVFLPVCLAGYFLLNHFHKETLAQVFLLGMSLWFYGYFHPSYLILILFSICLNYLLSLGIRKSRGLWMGKALLIAAVAANLGILFYFKYYNFFLETVATLLHTELTLRTILLPLGISFFTFQQLSFVVDTYRGEVQPHGFLQYACFVTYFPQLIAGPIVTHDELIPQFLDPQKKHFQWDNFASGLFMFALGLGKKVLLADVFGHAASWGFSYVDQLDTTNALMTSLAYTFQIYFDFSGYCDMAVGIGRMMNIDLPDNFDSPYKALTITEFWQRWHKTLTRFFTRYLYIPLGGNRRGTVRTYVNVMIVFLASGLWHGANNTFILWGALHGLFSVVTRHWKRWFQNLHPALSWLITFSFLNLTWILFRANSVWEAFVFLKRLLSMEFGPIHPQILSAFQLPEWTYLIQNIPALEILTFHPGLLLGGYFALALFLVLGVRNAREHMLTFRPTLANLLTTVVLLVWSVLSFSGVSIFLYYNF